MIHNLDLHYYCSVEISLSNAEKGETVIINFIQSLKKKSPPSKSPKQHFKVHCIIHSRNLHKKLDNKVS